MLKPLFYIFITFLLSVDTTAQYTLGESYFGINNYIEYIPGDLPIIFVAPHAGDLEPETLPDIYTRGADNGTMELALFMADSMLYKTGGCRPHVIINHLRPSKLNPTYTDSTEAAGSNTVALQAFNDFHNFIQIAHDKVSNDWGKGHYFELHGNGAPEKWNMIGLGVSKSYLSLPDSSLVDRTNYSTIKNLCTTGGVDFLEVLKGSTSLGGLLQTAGWKSTTSPEHPSPPDSVTFYYAGQNTWQYGSRYSGTIDATHLESYWEFMVLDENKSKYSNDLTASILTFMEINYDFSFNCDVSIEKIDENKNQIIMVPNPTMQTDFVKVESKEEIKTVAIYNSHGKVCFTIIETHYIPTKQLDKGVYFIIIETVSGEKDFKKLIVN